MEHVSLENVSKTYRLNGRDVVALKDFSFRFQAGESYLLSGPSGSGKTTLLSLLGGLDYPSSGKIFYDDLEISGLSLPQLGELRRQKLAFIFQDYVLFDELTVLDNVALAVQIAGVEEKEAERQAREWIERVGLADRLDHHPYQLSGGEKQRVGVARALVKQPQILLADEPTSNLDDENRTVICKALIEYHRETEATLIVATHDRIFLQLTDRTLNLRNGSLASPSELPRDDGLTQMDKEQDPFH